MAFIRVSLVARLAMMVKRSILVRLMTYCLVGVALASVALYFAERHAPQLDDNGDPIMQGGQPVLSEYHSYAKTMLNLIILFTSGFDVNPPQTVTGKAAAFFAMFLGICFLGLFTGEVAAFLVERRMKGGQGMHPVKCSNHVIITRWSKETEEIIAQLVSEDLKSKRDIVVIDREVTELPLTHPRVFFVKGDPTDAAVLERAGVHRAHTAIVLADHTTSDYNAEDSRNILTTLAIESINDDVYTVVEILNPDNKKHLERANADEVICTTDLATKMVVQSSVNHGLSGILSDLLSFGEGSEIYRVPLGARWTGVTFNDLMAKLRTEHKATLLAVESGETTHINPQEEVTIQPGDHAFLLAEDFPEAITQ